MSEMPTFQSVTGRSGVLALRLRGHDLLIYSTTIWLDLNHGHDFGYFGDLGPEFMSVWPPSESR